MKFFGGTKKMKRAIMNEIDRINTSGLLNSVETLMIIKYNPKLWLICLMTNRNL